MTLRDLAVNVGYKLARQFFKTRSRGGRMHTEVHVDQKQLACFAAIAFEDGYKAALLAHRARSEHAVQGGEGI